jgi:hypothetical protein
MDEELKQHLRGMEERIVAALERTKSQLVFEIRSHVGEKTLDPVAQKLEGGNDDSVPDNARIEADR